MSKSDKLNNNNNKNNNKRNNYILMRDIHVMMILAVNINIRKRYRFSLGHTQLYLYFGIELF
jgi:hypothetical protein